MHSAFDPGALKCMTTWNGNKTMKLDETPASWDRAKVSLGTRLIGPSNHRVIDSSNLVGSAAEGVLNNYKKMSNRTSIRVSDDRQDRIWWRFGGQPSLRMDHAVLPENCDTTKFQQSLPLTQAYWKPLDYYLLSTQIWHTSDAGGCLLLDFDGSCLMPWEANALSPGPRPAVHSWKWAMSNDPSAHWSKNGNHPNGGKMGERNWWLFLLVLGFVIILYGMLGF